MQQPAELSPAATKQRNPWWWVPSLYFAQGIPYVVVMTVSVVMYKRMGISNTDIALYTSWLYLPWVIKPLWSPIVEMFRTKRFWIVSMQLLVGAGLAGVALTMPMPAYFTYSLAFLWLLAFSSATHDIAADGFYMLGLDQHSQTWFVGVRSTFYRIAMITGQGLLVILAGYIESHSGLQPVSVQVRAVQSAGEFQWTHPEAIDVVPEEGELRIIAALDTVSLMPLPVKKSEADLIHNLAKISNTHNRFIIGEEEIKAKHDEEANWWSRNIADPLTEWTKRNFGPSTPMAKGTDAAGNVAFLRFRLSKPPEEGKEVVVTVSREKGDESIAIIEGTRFVFTKDNWNREALTVVQLDPKLRAETAATVIARSGNIPLSWMVTFFVLAGLFILLFLYHNVILPKPATDMASASGAGFLKDFFITFAEFFKKKGIVVMILFLLLYRFAEAQLVKLIMPFLLDPKEVGGLGLTTGEVGLVYGTLGILALTLGGILGGFLAAKLGLKRALWWLVCAIHLPCAAFVYLAYAQPDSLWVIGASVMVEQFGYGFGFTAYMLYMIYISEGKFKTAHYAISTGFMALGMMLPGMFSGWLQETVGYQHFFVWVMMSTIPGFLMAAFLKIDPNFGRKVETQKA